MSAFRSYFCFDRTWHTQNSNWYLFCDKDTLYFNNKHLILPCFYWYSNLHNGARNWESSRWHVRSKICKSYSMFNWIFLYFSCHFRISNDNITACLSANRHGLCIGGMLTWILVGIETDYISNLFCSYLTARGNISQNSSGVLVALLDQAQKLEPQSGPPVVILETSKKYDRNHLKYYCLYGER